MLSPIFFYNSAYFIQILILGMFYNKNTRRSFFQIFEFDDTTILKECHMW